MGPPSWADLPEELALKCLERLSHTDVASAALVCRNWALASMHPRLWQTLYRRRWPTASSRLPDDAPWNIMFAERHLLDQQHAGSEDAGIPTSSLEK